MLTKEQKLNIIQLRRKASDKRLAKQQELANANIGVLVDKLTEVGESMYEVSKRLGADASRPITVENKVEVNGLEAVAESIKNLKYDIVVNAPEVKVQPVLVNEDINARYKRADSIAEKTFVYHGFVDKNGNWFIQRESGGETKARSAYYTDNVLSYGEAWIARSTHKYRQFDEVKIR